MDKAKLVQMRASVITEVPPPLLLRYYMIHMIYDILTRRQYNRYCIPSVHDIPQLLLVAQVEAKTGATPTTRKASLKRGADKVEEKDKGKSQPNKARKAYTFYYQCSVGPNRFHSWLFRYNG